MLKDVYVYIFVYITLHVHLCCMCVYMYAQQTSCPLFCLCAGGSKGKDQEEKLPLFTGLAFHAGRNKGKGLGEKLPLLAVQCLEALLTLGRTAEGVAEVLQDVPVAEDHVPMASDAGAHMLLLSHCMRSR